MSKPRPIGDPLAAALPEPEAPTETAAPETSTDVGGALEAGTFGALQGLTGNLFGFGLSKLHPSTLLDVATPVPESYRAATRREQERVLEEHPFARGVGEFAGMLLSPLGKVGGATTKAVGATSTAGRIAAEGLGQAAVGSLYGAGHALSDAALGDHEVTADKLIAGAGLGALLGGGGGLLGGAITETAGAMLPSLSKSVGSAQKGLEDFAADRWLKASGGVQAEIKAIPLDKRGAVADVLREHFLPPGQALPKADLKEVLEAAGQSSDAVAADVLQQAGVGKAGGLLPSMTRDEAQAALEAGMAENGQQMGSVLKGADTAGATFNYPAALQRFEDFEKGLNVAERDIIAADLDKVRSYLGEMADATKGAGKGGFEALNGLKSTLQSNTNFTADGAAKWGLKRQLVGILRDELDTQFAPQVGSTLAKDFLDAKAAYGALANAEKALGRKAATGADAVAAIAEGAKLASPEVERFAALQHANRLLRRGVDRELGNRWISLSDYLTGLASGVAHGNAGGAALGVASALGHKVLRERGAALVAQTAQRIAASPALSTIATSFAQKVPTLAPHMGPYGAALAQAANDSPHEALAHHMVMAQSDEGYRQQAQVAGLLPEDAQQHGAALTRAHGLAQVAAAVTQHDAAVDKAVSTALKGDKEPPKAKAAHGTQDFGTKRMRRPEADAHAARVDEVRKMAAEPQALLERVGANLGNLDNVAPGLAGALTRRAHAAVQFLSNEARTPAKAGPLAQEWAPTEHERWAYAQKLEAVEDPLSALRHAAAGTLTGAHVAALRAVYPALHAEISTRLLQRVAEKPGSVPYAQRIALSLFTGVDLDGTMNPASIAANQAAIHRPSEKPSNAGAPASKAGDLTLAQRTATPTQRREMREEA